MGALGWLWLALGWLALGWLVFGGVTGGVVVVVVVVVVTGFVWGVSENADAMIACAIGSSSFARVMGSVAGLVERLRVRRRGPASSAVTFSDMYLDGNMSDNNRFTSRRSYLVAFAAVAFAAVAFVNDAAVDWEGLTSVVASLALALMPTNSFSTSLSVASLSGEEGGWGALGSGPFAWPLHVRVDSSFFLVVLVDFFGMVEMWMGMPCELVSCIVFIFDFLFSIFSLC